MLPINYNVTHGKRRLHYCMLQRLHTLVNVLSSIGNDGLAEIHKTITVVNLEGEDHESKAQVVCMVTVECISVVNNY